jgi:hypothetical protein
MSTLVPRELISNAISNGIKRYIQQRRVMVDEFVTTHYSIKGAAKLHRNAFGWDLIKVPINIVLSIFNLLMAVITFIADFALPKSISTKIRRTPFVVKTKMDTELEKLIIKELLELPCSDDQTVPHKDALLKAILDDGDLQKVINSELDAFIANHPDARYSLDELLRKFTEYSAARTATADLASNAALLLYSKITMGTAAFGSLSAGSALALSVAQSAAITEFWAGPFLGGLYYSHIGVTASLRLVIAMTLLVAVVLAIVATFSGVITDPIQAKLGIHHRRLNKMLDSLESDFLKSDNRFSLKEKYAGRFFDLLDILSVAARKF